MNTNIDIILENKFTPERIIEAFYDYKRSKWDHFSDPDTPEINVPMGADGIKYEAFEKQIDRNAKNISNRVRNDSYVFYPFREVDKPKKPDLPLTPDNTRTLGIASVRDALVQIVLYEDVLYDVVESQFRELDKYGPVSFAYRKGKSAPKAAQIVHGYAQQGYWHAYDADLSKYFDSIPHEKLLSKLASLLGGNNSKTYRLVRRFVKTDRVPHKKYKYAVRKGKIVGHKIFHWRKPPRRIPKAHKGVPQGGILSGMLANLFLHDFDEWVVKELGREIDLKYVRYADDFVIMVRTPDLLESIAQQVSTKLRSESYELDVNEAKSKAYTIQMAGLEFLGFNFVDIHLRARERTVERFKDRILNDVLKARPPKKQISPKSELRRVVGHINSKIGGAQGKEVCPKCRCSAVRPSRSWVAFFSVVTDVAQLRDLDKWIRQSIYTHMYGKYRVRINRRMLKRPFQKRSLKSLVNEKFRVQSAGRRPCLCDLQQVKNDVWKFARDLYEGKSFKTLYKHREFRVPYVDDNILQVSVGGKQYKITKKTFQNIWNALVRGETIRRAELEKNGIENASHVVALIAELPGVEVSLNPIALTFKQQSPANFLVKP